MVIPTFEFCSSKRKKDSSSKPQRLTTVVITLEESTISGSSLQSTSDVDNKVLGQKYAVRNALRKVDDRKLRKLVWYFFFMHSKRTARLKE